MNKRDAKQLALNITREQLVAMFERAKTSITDWREPCKANPGITLGAAWNIYYPGLMKGLSSVNMGHVKTNMLWVFGDYLDEALKPQKPDQRKAPAISVFHQEPVFDVESAKPKCWPCWSCHAPVTMANRADADGHCPHCEAELDIESWPFPEKK